MFVISKLFNIIGIKKKKLKGLKIYYFTSRLSITALMIESLKRKFYL